MDSGSPQSEFGIPPRHEPPYSEEMGEFVCECGAPERALIEHDNDALILVCATCFTYYDKPKEGPWPS